MLINNKNFCIIIPVLTNLLAAGADLFVVDDDGCSVVCYATSRYMLKPSNAALNLLYFLIELPVFSDFTLKCKPGYLPHDILLNNSLNITPTALKKIFKFIFNSAFKNYKYKKNMTYKLKNVQGIDICFQSINCGFVTAFLLTGFRVLYNKEVKPNKDSLFYGNVLTFEVSDGDVKVLERLLVTLLDLGLSLSDGDSPLALFMALQYKYEDKHGTMLGYGTMLGFPPPRIHKFQLLFERIIEIVVEDAESSSQSQCKKLQASKKHHIQPKLDAFHVPDVVYIACVGCKYL
jgi:hypothetical protein